MAKPKPVPCDFCGEKRLKNFFADGDRNSRTIVLNVDQTRAVEVEMTAGNGAS